MIKIKKSTIKTINIVLSCIFVVSALIGFIFLFTKNSEEKSKTLSTSVFTVGGLTDNGTYLDFNGSIYTKEPFYCLGLSIESDFESNVEYKVYFYDINGNFLYSSPSLSKNYEPNLEFGVVNARVVITPNDDENIKWYEISGYAKQITIKVYKEQKISKLSVNMFSFAHTGNTTEQLGVYGDSDWQSCATPIEIIGCSKVIVKGKDMNSAIISLYDASGVRVYDAEVDFSGLVADANGFYTYEFNLSGLSNNATVFQLCYSATNEYEIYLSR